MAVEIESSATQGQKVVADMLSVLLANTYALYLKTQNYHWNVVGPEFYTLHSVFESHYTELAEAVDVIAERVRQVNCFVPGSFKDFLKLTTIEEAKPLTAAKVMVKNLLADHESITTFIRDNLSIPENNNDQGTANLLDDRIDWHEKTAWMLRAYLS